MARSVVPSEYPFCTACSVQFKYPERQYRPTGDHPEAGVYHLRCIPAHFVICKGCEGLVRPQWTEDGLCPDCLYGRDHGPRRWE